MYQCVISLDSQMMADYFRYLFPPRDGDDSCVVSVSRPTGALLVAFAEPSLFPVHVAGDYLVKVDLPWVRNATSSLQDHYVTMDKEAMARVNLALKAEFDIEFAGYLRKGEELQMRKMDIIDAFIFSRHLAPETYDALHKRSYRKALRAQEVIRKKLLRRAYYLNESIDFIGLTESK